MVKRNNSYHRDNNEIPSKNDDCDDTIRKQVKTHRLSESKRRKSVDLGVSESERQALARGEETPVGLPLM